MKNARSPAREAVIREREALAATTSLGVGATWAGALYWVFVGAYLAWRGTHRGSLAVVLVAGMLLVYPIGYALTHAAGGDLLARRHPWGGIVRTLWVTEFVGWPILGVLWIQAPHLVVFGLAASLGMHFIPFAWLYRFGPYAALAVWSVLGACFAQVFLAAAASRVIPIGMSIGYALAAISAHRVIARMRS
jgi:hypothetical protein